jgi:hypothetical protein
MRGFNDTTLGMLHAHHLITEQQNRRAAAPRKPRYTYEKAGTAVHATHCISQYKRDQINGLLNELSGVDPDNGDLVKDLITQITKLPTKFVSIKRAIPIARGKTYPYRSAKRTAPLLQAA